MNESVCHGRLKITEMKTDTDLMFLHNPLIRRIDILLDDPSTQIKSKNKAMGHGLVSNSLPVKALISEQSKYDELYSRVGISNLDMNPHVYVDMLSSSIFTCQKSKRWAMSEC